MQSANLSELAPQKGETLTNPSEIAEATLRAVKRERSMLITAWPRHMQQEFPNLNINGDYECHLIRNIIMLSGVSEEIARAFSLIQTGHILSIDFADPMLFFWEGAPIYKLPIAKRIPEKGYAKPHWLPLQWILMPSQ